jgi:nucleotide-binding universal stress UspA family protein
MYRKLLVACDGSEGSQIAVLHASILAKKLGAELSALWVRGSLPHYPETIDEIDVEEESAHEFFENLKAQLQSVGAGQGVTIRPEMRTGHPAQQILEFARAHDTDLIVLGSRGHSRLWGELIGHTADRVNEHAPCSVLIVRSVQEAACYRKTLVAYDGSDAADTALRHALALAKHIGSEAHLLWIQENTIARSQRAREPGEDEKRAREFFHTVLRERIDAAAAEQGVAVKAGYRCGNAAQTLVAEVASGGFRLIVLGHRGHSGLWGKLLGGVADRVSHLARCDVLIVRKKERL